MNEFEVTFRTSPLDEAAEDFIIDDLDGFVGGHGDVTLVTVSCRRRSGIQAAVALAARLQEAGIRVMRVEPDLVTASMIAERCGATRQAVGNWARGARRVGAGFPTPVHLVAGDLWRWQEVNEWLRSQGKTHDNCSYLTYEDELCVNYRLAVQNRADRRLPAWGVPAGAMESRIHQTRSTTPRVRLDTAWHDSEIWVSGHAVETELSA